MNVKIISLSLFAWLRMLEAKKRYFSDDGFYF
jgi:hypothetical protein